MSIAISDVSRIVQYTATSSQTDFTVPFVFLEDTDVKAYQRSAGSTGDDSVDILTLTTDYTLTGAGDAAGGTLTLVTGATTGDIITIVGDDPIERSSYYTTNPTVAGFNEDFEKQTIFNRLNETLRTTRMLSYQRSETIGDADRDIPPLSPLHCWRMNSTGTAIESVEVVDEEGAAPRSATYITQTSNTLLSAEQALADLDTGIVMNTTGTGVLTIATAGSDYLTDVVQDTTPQLGGNLDLNSKNVTGTGEWRGTAVTQTYGGTGIDTSGVTDGQLLIGGTASNDFQLATLTGTTNQIITTTGTNSITLSTPQSIGTSNSPTFTGLTLSGLSTDGVVKTASGVLGSEQYLSLDAGGTGIDSSGATDGQLLIGGTSSNDLQLATLTGTANQITVTNGTNSVILSAPQDLAAASSPTFTGLTLSGVSTDGVVKAASGVISSEAQLSLADGGTGIDSSGATDGQLLIGGTSSNDLQLATLTEGSGISITNGTNSVTIAATASSDWVHLNTQTASASASIIFDNTYITDTYDIYKIFIYNMVTSQSNVEFHFNVSDDNGSTWKTSSAYAYGYVGYNTGAVAVVSSTSADNLKLATDIDTGNSYEIVSAEYTLFAPTDASLYTKIQGELYSLSSTEGGFRAFGNRLTAEDNDAIRFILNAGTITSGTFVLYGLKTS